MEKITVGFQEATGMSHDRSTWFKKIYSGIYRFK